MSFLPLLLAFMLALGIISFLFWRCIQKHKAKTRHTRRMLYKGISAVLHYVNKALDTYCLSHRIENFKKTIDVMKRPKEMVSASKESEYINRVLYHEKTTADELLKKINSPIPVSHAKLEEYKAVATKQLEAIDELFDRRNKKGWTVENEAPLNKVFIGNRVNTTNSYHPHLMLAGRVATAVRSLKLFEIMVVASENVAVQMFHVVNCLTSLEMRLHGILRNPEPNRHREKIIFSPEVNSYHWEAGSLSMLLSQEMNDHSSHRFKVQGKILQYW